MRVIAYSQTHREACNGAWRLWGRVAHFFLFANSVLNTFKVKTCTLFQEWAENLIAVRRYIFVGREELGRFQSVLQNLLPPIWPREILKNLREFVPSPTNEKRKRKEKKVRKEENNLCSYRTILIVHHIMHFKRHKLLDTRQTFNFSIVDNNITHKKVYYWSQHLIQ